MSTVKENPHLVNLERAPYELGHLLAKIGRPESDEDLKDLSSAAETHAENAKGTLLRGMEAIGHMLAVAAGNKESGVEPCEMASLGWLITHIACELQFYEEVETVTYTAQIFADVSKSRSKGKVTT